jgi:hypothetical protein
MVEMSVKRRRKGRSLLHEPYPGMASAVDSSLVAFGLAEPPFQVQVVLGHVGERTDKQPSHEAGHQFGHVLAERTRQFGESPSEFLKLAATLFGGTLGRVERVSDGLDLLDLTPQFLLVLVDGMQPALDACG